MEMVWTEGKREQKEDTEVDHVPSVRLVAALSSVEGSDECLCARAGGLLTPAWQLILNSEAPPPGAISSVGAH